MPHYDIRSIYLPFVGFWNREMKIIQNEERISLAKTINFQGGLWREFNSLAFSFFGVRDEDRNFRLSRSKVENNDKNTY